MLLSCPRRIATLGLILFFWSAPNTISAATGFDVYDEIDLTQNGRLGIYEARIEIVDELRKEILEITEKRDQLRLVYKERHPRMIAISEQLKVLNQEMDRARKATIDTATSLTLDERTILIEQFRAELELEAARKRAELASLHTRYKEKFPSVIEKRIELETLNQSLNAFYESDIVNLASDLEELERLHVQTAIFKKKAELRKLESRYLKKHPFVIQIKGTIRALQSELDAISKPKLSTDQNDASKTRTDKNSSQSKKWNAKLALLREEIALVESHVKQLESKSKTTKQEITRWHHEQLELLKLKHELASREGNRSDQSDFLSQQRALLEQLIKNASTPEASYQYKRQHIAIRRAKIDLEK
jgi:hypothetical protein